MNYRIIIVEARPEHVARLAAILREADRREIWASGRQTPGEALTLSLKASARAWTALAHGWPAAMWGVARAGPAHRPVGRPWLLASEAITNVAGPEFIRRSREFVEEMRAEFPRLENYVHAGNRRSVRWLSWCGFAVDEAPVEINGEAFFRFHWEAAEA